MPELAPVPLTPCPIELDSLVFQAICDWPFDDPYVGRLLRNDIPRPERLNCCWIWVYCDPAGRLAGFGTLDVCDDCSEFTEGRSHLYIPLLAKNPTIKSLGYGASIVRHLVDEATVIGTSTIGFMMSSSSMSMNPTRRQSVSTQRAALSS